MSAPSSAPADRLRIAYVMINCNRRDGSARALNEVAERMARRHEVHLFARRAEEIDLTHIQWHRVPGLPWPEAADFTTFYWNCSRQLRAHRFDIVHSVGCNADGPNVFTIQNVQPAKREHLRAIASHETISAARRLTRWAYLELTTAAERRLYRPRAGQRPPLFLPVSQGVEADLRRWHPIGPAPVIRVPNAADPAIFRPATPADRTHWRRANGFADTAPLLVFAGGEWARKGLDLALASLPHWGSPGAQLVVCGDDPDRDRFVRLAASLGISAQVRFLGFRRDVHQVMAAADAFLFPSRYEAFSLAVIEAAACGLPIFAPRISGCEDFIEPGVNGDFLEFDAGKIAAVIRSALARPDWLRAAGACAREKVERHYTWDHVASQTEAAYRQYLASADPHAPAGR